MRIRSWSLAQVIASLFLAPVAILAQQPDASLRGSVADPYAVPLAAVAVQAVSPAGYRFQATTSADGVYLLAGLVPGPYEVTFESEGFRSERVSVLLRNGSPLVQDVVLEPLIPASLAGRVVDQQGLALPGADVTATSSGARVQRAVTDQAGGFRFPDLRPGVWEVVARLPGFEAGRAVADVVFGEPAAVRVALALGYSLAEQVVVVGSRRATAQRRVSESLVPVDVLGAEDIRSQPHADMANLLRALAPSFNVNTQPISDAATVVRPVNLRNLAPDHLLVLVNGKRRHRAAVIAWLGNGISDGSQGPDVSVIPAIAVRQVELLRDGAAAQYGSDAIAGVVNFQIHDARRGGSLQLSTGTFVSPNTGDAASCRPSPSATSGHACDAIGGRSGAYSLAGNVGLPIGRSGFANLSLEYGGAQPTNRAVQRLDAAELLDAGNRSVRWPAQVWGRPGTTDDLKTFANLGVDFGRLRAYGYLSHAARTVTGGFYFRHPYTRSGVFRGPLVDGQSTLLVGDRIQAASQGAQTADCPVVPILQGRPEADALARVEADPDCFTLYSRFPGGFTPRFGGQLYDGAAVGGLRYLREDGLGWDLSASVGRSRIDQFLDHSVNASLGFDTPTSFRPGSAEQTDHGVNFDVAVPVHDRLHLAAGGEWRREAFGLFAGDAASWEIGPYARQGFSSGSNGFTGYRPETAGYWSRPNVAAYVDGEYRGPGDRWSIGSALRVERFADFGTTVNGKLAGRIGLPARLALRGAVSTGFRAPTPGQQHAFNVTTAFLGGELVNRGVVPPTSAVAVARGGRQLEPERSVHYSVGLVRSGTFMQLAVDAFRVDVSDRLALSQEVRLTPAEVQVLLSEGLPEARNFPVFRFFVNDFATTTQGVDVSWDWQLGRHTVGAASSFTSTRVHSLLGMVIDRRRVETIERGLPAVRWQVWARPVVGPWRFLLRYNFYGSYWDYEDANNAHGAGFVSQTWLYPAYAGRGLLDFEAQLPLGDATDLSLGFSNALAVHPEENPYAQYTVGNRYGQFSPFGFDGSYLYARLAYRWGS